MDGLILTNANQKKVVDEVHQQLLEYSRIGLHEEGPSNTFAPYFDPTLNDEQKGNLVEVPTSSLISDKVN
jgi:hypothetical protein